MFGGAIGAEVTPASMLDHRALGYYYDRDDALEARVIERGLPEIIPGDPVSVELETPQVVFNDVPEDETTKRAALFRISGCGPVTFRVLSEPPAPFSLFAGGPYPFPSGGFPTDELRIWFLYTAGAAGSTDSGTVSIAAEDELGNGIERWEDIPLIGNAVARERVAVVAVLDESGSMLYDAGNNRTRLQALQLAANAFIDQLYDDNGLALVEFADSASALTGLDEAGPLTSSTRNGARTEISTHGPPDIYQHTSIGAGLETAADIYATSPAASDYDIQATLVFTDGVEDRPPYIDEVASSINERVYAIGVADAANVNNDNLRAIADNSGGFMLVTGALALDDEFLLEKFFIQVLAVVANRDIVRDPPGWIVPGEVEQVPFHIARSDIAFDAVALSRAPQYIVLGLQTPDGTVVSHDLGIPESEGRDDETDDG
jgi:Mg-chelatase subunit ChlD